MEKLIVPPPVSLGLLLSYKCNIACKDCIYSCSPKWKDNWISEKDSEKILSQLSYIFKKVYPYKVSRISFSYGLHFTGGEPFLNYPLLLKLTGLAKNFDIPFPFVETNCFWAKDDEKTKQKLLRLKKEGLSGILISINPFMIEYIPFERVERAVKASIDIFGGNAIIYQAYYLNEFRKLKLKGRLSLRDYLDKIEIKTMYRYIELLPMGRAPYKLDYLYRKYPASYFFSNSCREELARNWHTHIDNFCNYIPGFCSGISLGDARNLGSIFGGISLDKKPVLKALSTKLEELYEIGKYFGYKENSDGYISKCHLCVDIRKYLVETTDEFSELVPKEFYLNLN